MCILNRKILLLETSTRTALPNVWQLENLTGKLPCMACGDAPSRETPPECVMQLFNASFEREKKKVSFISLFEGISYK